MSILAKLFGNCGKIRFEGTTIAGVSFSGKMKIETFAMEQKEIEQELKKIFYVETGKVVKTLNITAYYGT